MIAEFSDRLSAIIKLSEHPDMAIIIVTEPLSNMHLRIKMNVARFVGLHECIFQMMPHQLVRLH